MIKILKENLGFNINRVSFAFPDVEVTTATLTLLKYYHNR